MSFNKPDIQHKNIKSTDCISKNSGCVTNKLEDSESNYYNTVSGVSTQHLQVQLANQKIKDSCNPPKSPNPSNKKHSGGFLKNLFGRSNKRTISLNIPVDQAEFNSQDLSNIPVHRTMDNKGIAVQLPVHLSVGPDEFIQLYRQRTLSDCGSIENTANRQKSMMGIEDSGDFLIDDCCDDMSKFHFLIWKDKFAGTKYFKLLKSTGLENEVLTEPNHVFKKFLSDHAAYDLMPQSVKLLTFNTKLTVKKAFFAMVENLIKAGVLWDSTKQKIIGMLTITDFMELLLKLFKNEQSFDEIENHSIKIWKEQLHERALISLGPEDSLLYGCELLLKEKVHRCLVLDKFSGNPLYVLTQKRILRFLYTNFEFIKMPDFVQSSIKELNCGTYQNISTISYSTKLLKVLQLFVENRISALPVVDENQRLINVFSKVDFANLVPDKLYQNMEMSADEALHCRKGTFEKAYTCLPTDSLLYAIEKIVVAEVHRLIIVDNDMRVVGILSLSDILKCLIAHSASNTT